MDLLLLPLGLQIVGYWSLSQSIPISKLIVRCGSRERLPRWFSLQEIVVVLKRATLEIESKGAMFYCKLVRIFMCIGKLFQFARINKGSKFNVGFIAHKYVYRCEFRFANILNQHL
jgi:hypothetical protein